MPLRLFPLPPEPGATQALETWETVHKEEFLQLIIRFGRLYLAINAQERDHLKELKLSLATWDDDISDWYLSLCEDVGKLAAGYGGPSVLSRYYAAIESAHVHQERYRQLRAGFDAFLNN